MVRYFRARQHPDGTRDGRQEAKPHEGTCTFSRSRTCSLTSTTRRCVMMAKESTTMHWSCEKGKDDRDDPTTCSDSNALLLLLQRNKHGVDVHDLRHGAVN